MTDKSKDQNILFSVRMPKSLHNAIKAVAEDDMSNCQIVIRQALRVFCQSRGKQIKSPTQHTTNNNN
jgi:hypothetical protein